MGTQAQRIVAFCFLAAGALVFAGCRRTSSTQIAVIPETTAEELWESEHAGAEQMARQLGWSVYWNAPSREDDVARQIQIVDQEIDRYAGGLILSPDHAIALIAPVRRALMHNIPVVIVGSRLDAQPDARLHFVLNDEQRDGQLAAERAELYLKPTSTIAVLGVDPNLPGSVLRADALEDEIRRARPGVRIVERRLTSVGFAEVEEVAEEVIRSEPDLSVIVSLNVNQTRGAYQALQSAGAMGRIRLIGCDQDLDLLHHLRTGGIDSIVAENTFRMGSDAMQILQHVRSGEPAADETIEPVLITRANVDTDAVQKLLSMDWMGR